MLFAFQSHEQPLLLAELCQVEFAVEQPALDDQENEARDTFLRYFFHLQDRPRYAWEIGQILKVVPRMYHTIPPANLRRDLRWTAAQGHKQVFYLHQLANGNQLRFTHVKEAQSSVAPRPHGDFKGF